MTMLNANLKMEWKKQNKTLQILIAAEKGKYGVVAPIAYVSKNIHHKDRMTDPDYRIPRVIEQLRDRSYISDL